MGHHVSGQRDRRLLAGFAALVAALLATQGWMYGQGGRGPAAGSQPPPAKAAAPFDPTGYWVSVITQNWRLRMVPAAKGDYIGIPISAAGKKAADGWDLAKDEAAGNECKSYGAAGILNLPERLHITWQDDNTLRMDIDSGTQTRLFHFGNWTPQAKRTWQGDSVAVWESRRGGRGGPSSSRYLKVTTTNMLAGYLRKNGVPYGDNASLTEYFDLFQEPGGAALIIATAVVEDPANLETPYIVSSQFKKQADASGWDPTPCSAKW